MLSWKQAVLIVILGFIAEHICKLVFHYNLFRTVYEHHPGPCRVIKEIQFGSEDIETLPNGVALISSGLKALFPDSPYFKDVRGKIFSFDFNKPNDPPKEVKVVGVDPNTFQPHGISLWVDKDTGEVTMFIVHQLQYHDSIEKFKYDQDANTLTHVKSIRTPLMTSLDDVVAVSADSFYWTNNYNSDNRWIMDLEINLMLHWGGLGFYDGNHARIVYEGLFSPDGMNVSPDLKYLYVSYVIPQAMGIFKIMPNWELELHQDVFLGTHPDNIDIEPDTGNLWIGAHPVWHKMWKHIANPDKQESPSQVLRLEMQDGNVTSIREVMLDSGKLLSASTTANYYKGAMLVGSVDNTMLYCKVKAY